MSQESRKQLGQFIVLAILLLVLGFCMWYFLFKPQHAGKGASTADRSAKTAPQADQPAAAQAAGTTEKGAPANGAAGAEQATTKAAGTEKDKEKLARAGAPFSMEMNPNQFEVFTLSPPKNPFVQQERWYADKLKDLPGYPELRDQGYFDSMDAYLPDLEKYFGSSDKWQEVKLTRQQTVPNYSIEGTSKEGDISTSVQITGAEEPPVDITWTPESGIPLSALRTPGWDKKLPAAAAGMEQPGAGGQAAAPAGGALAVPGAGQAAGGGGAAGAAGDTISVSGVNLKEGTSSAVMVYNGTPYLVSEGSVLPTHYQVLAIKADGVVLLELRDGSSQWIPLSVAGPADRQKR